MTAVRPLRIALLLGLWLSLLNPAAAEPFVIGPMPGHSAMRAVSLWLQLKNVDQVAVEYWPEREPTNRTRTPAYAVDPAQDGIVQMEIGGLKPTTRYGYRLVLDGKAVEAPEPLFFHTQPLWQWRADPPPFRALVGCCNFINDKPLDHPGRGFGADYQIFEHMADQKADLMLWLGDTLYLREADYDSAWGIADRYRETRAFPPLQRLLRSTHHYALWDDHDYGANNANASYALKAESLKQFQRYWPNPSYGLPGVPGIFTRFAWHDVEFFLLDDRWYRNADAAPDVPGKAMFGAAQLAWLKDALLSSPATFKVIASGSQLLNDVSRAEGWQHFPAERQAFLDWLAAAHVDGVVFLAGDRHRTELARLERPGSYPLYELTCSPLTASARPARDAEEQRPGLVEGTRVEKRNFCRLDVDGPLSNRTMTVRVFDADGEALWHQTLRAGALRTPR